MHAPLRSTEKKFAEKLSHLNWGLVFLVALMALVGIASLYSAGGGAFDPWASRQAMRFVISVIIALVIALIDIRIWFRFAWPIYALGLALLIAVEIMGHIGMGAQRWINLGFMKLQPSEMMKIAVVIALARYFHGATPGNMRNILFLIAPALIIALPIALVLMQPDLGTSLMIACAGLGMFFVAGAPIWLFVVGGGLVVFSVPVIWMFMHAYQKQRVLTFLDPSSDPLGAGYHITQSKIALGSGGFEGKGFLQGTQSHLNFLPEKQTDFIFTLWAEEWGFIGGVGLLLLISLIFLYCLWISFQMRISFSRYLVLGLLLNFSLYVFINIGMVMGLLPVVGAPLPLISYGGTSMLAVMIGFGLIMSAYVHKDSRINTNANTLN